MWKAFDRSADGKVILPFALDRHQQELITKDYPGIEFQFGTASHSHPLSAIARRLGEQIAYNRCTQDAPSGALIGDIGANPKRHASRGRSNVWSMCPIIDPQDICRQHYNVQDRVCQHKLLECDHGPFHSLMSVHSIYYLEPAAILTALRRTTSKTMYVVCHMFQEALGQLAHGEATYEVQGSKCYMSVVGNSHAYLGSSLAWMQNSSYFRPLIGHEILAWTLDQQLPCSTWIYKFVYGVYPQEFLPSVPSNFLAATNSSAYCKFKFNQKLHDRDVEECRMGVALLESADWWTFGTRWCIGIKTSVYYYVPSGLFNNCRAKIAGTQRTAQQFSNLVAHCRRVATDHYNIPLHHLAQTIMATSVLAFTIDLEQETGMLNAMAWNSETVREQHSQALRLESKRVLDSRLLLGTGVVGTGGLYVARNVAPKPLMLLASLGLGVVFAAASYANIVRKSRSGHSQPLRDRPPSPPSKDAAGAPTNETYALETGVEGIIYSGEPFCRSEVTVDRPILTIDPSARIRPESPVVDRPSRTVLHCLGLAFKGHVPVVHANNQSNEIVAINNRALPVQSAVSQEHMSEFRSFVMSNIEELFDTTHPHVYDNPVVGVYEEWNARFPRNQQLRHNRCRQRMMDFGYEAGRIVQRKTFIKVEKLLLHKFGSIQEKDPRVIQGAQDEFNIIVGPWIYAFSKLLAELWQDSHFLHYTSGRTAEQLGSWFNPEAVCYVENDFSRFDSSITRPLLELEIDIYRYFGMPNHISNLMKKSLYTVGYGRWGTKYEIDGTRHSGDPNTSCGNSMLNALLHAFWLVKHNNVPLLDLYLNKSGIKMAVLGDDNLIISQTRVLNTDGLDTFMMLYGLSAKPKIKFEHHDVEYCSGYFWPSTIGYRYGPKPGRFLTKAGWFIDPNPKDNPLRASMKSHERDVSSIPILREYVQTMLRLTPDTRYTFSREDRYRVHASMYGQPVNETYVMFDRLYGLSHRDVLNISELITTCERLPAWMHTALLERVFEKDTG